MRVYPLTGESSTPPTKRRWTTTPPTFKADLSGSAESIALSLRDVADINRQDVCRYKAQNEDDNGHCRHDEFSYPVEFVSEVWVDRMLFVTSLGLLCWLVVTLTQGCC